MENPQTQTFSYFCFFLEDLITMDFHVKTAKATKLKKKNKKKKNEATFPNGSLSNPGKITSLYFCLSALKLL